MDFKYDVIVVGAGHAGCEAAAAAARLGSRTLLITMDMNKIGQMSCNPAIGGIAKGQIVREIDALGGQMGIVTDQSAIQFRMLNRSKGPAMWSPRSQSDRKEYINRWTEVLSRTEGLHIWQDVVTNILVENGENGKQTVCGVRTALGIEMKCRSLVLTNGTFLNGLLHFGQQMLPGGRISEPASTGLTEQLRELGLRTDRMKTGTPARVDKRSIHFDELIEQKGDETTPGENLNKFSYLPGVQRELKQMSCWITYTNPTTHDILREGLPYSPLYNGQIHSIGPRYCPSVETKIVTFSDKDAHQIFLEPEGVDSNEYYINGFSSSLPWDIQWKALKTIKGLENIQLYRPGYAIEYDFFDPTQLYHSLETKRIDGLYMAGQINGTTGYEEAGGQGLIAGINAARKVHGLEAFTLGRDESYIGVLIDDLVNKGVDEPYRMFTSRAEYRILLRQDNADERLTEKAFQIGLATEERHQIWQTKKAQVAELLSELKSKKQDGHHLDELLRRPQITIHDLIDSGTWSEEVMQSAEIQVKYAGYIERERMAADKLHRLDNIRLSEDFDYNSIQSLSTEARQKLSRIKPATIGDAGRIPGISPNDISVLLVLLNR